MTDWITLSRQEHTQQRLLRRQGYGFSATHTSAPVVLAELGKVVAHYALAFQYQGDTLAPVALLGTQNNLYLAPEGRWLGGYVPASLRGYPLRLVAKNDNQVSLQVLADYLTAGHGQAIFNDDGTLTEKTQQAFDFLVQCEQSRQHALQATRQLDQAGVITPWPLTVTQPDGSPYTFEGLYQVDEKALNGLDDATFAQLKGAPLQLAYAQRLSVSQLSELGKRAELHARLAERQATQTVPENLDSVLDGMDDDDLEFDFND
jgi:hypothetical protein